MKKLPLLMLLMISNLVMGQESETVNKLDKKNEIRLNAVMLVAGAFEVTYERIINEESGFGGSIFVPIDAEIDTKLQATGFYRFYFGKKPAAGFFFEGFGMLNSYNQYETVPIYNFDPSSSYYYNSTYQKLKGTNTDFALGFGLGGKWITNRGLIFELSSGIGRNLFNGNDSDQKIVGKGGISVGYRF